MSFSNHGVLGNAFPPARVFSFCGFVCPNTWPWQPFPKKVLLGILAVIALCSLLLPTPHGNPAEVNGVLFDNLIGVFWCLGRNL